MLCLILANPKYRKHRASGRVVVVIVDDGRARSTWAPTVPKASRSESAI
jgi:hypothetical protein